MFPTLLLLSEGWTHGQASVELDARPHSKFVGSYCVELAAIISVMIDFSSDLLRVAPSETVYEHPVSELHALTAHCAVAYVLPNDDSPRWTANS